MFEPIEESYFNWLCSKVLSPTDTNYRQLLWILHSTEFVWVVPMDENRAMDGAQLRHNFILETRVNDEDVPDLWLGYGCSIFELILGFAYRVEFETHRPAREWFWIMIEHLGLGEFRRVYGDSEQLISDILHCFVWRLYEHDGSGGLWPIRKPVVDQREVEIWYQFCAYLEDQNLV